MSILNWWTDGATAIVSVDTMVMGKGGLRAEGSKLLPLAASNCLLAVRGERSMAHVAFGCAMNEGWGFDECGEFLPQAFKACAQITRGGELLLLGWSHREQSLRAEVHEFDGSRRQARARRINWCAAPGEPIRASDLEAISTVEGHKRIAQMQVTWARDEWLRHPDREEFGPAPVAGGRLIVATMSRHGLELCESELCGRLETC